MNFHKQFTEIDMTLMRHAATAYGSARFERNTETLNARLTTDAWARSFHVRKARSANRWLVNAKRQMTRAMEVST